MSIKNKLQIYLVTYNRKEKLDRTFKQILSKDSPIQNFDITILDNASTDGTSLLIDEYCKKYSNLKHIRHKINIGANANACRAFELGASCGKEYMWILCDDDYFDFECWMEVEQGIIAGDDIICVYPYPYKEEHNHLKHSYGFCQPGTLYGNIFKTTNICDDVMINMYDSIITMFPQTVLVAKCVNEHKNISVVSKPIVSHGAFAYNEKNDANYASFTRGQTARWFLDNRQKTGILLGFTQVLTLFNDKKVRSDTLESLILKKPRQLYHQELVALFTMRDFNYFYEIFKYLKFKRKLLVLFWYLPTKFIHTYKTKDDIRLYLFGAKFTIFPRFDKSKS